MLILSLIWLGGGALVGWLADVAALTPRGLLARGRWAAWGMCGIGALAACAGGLLSTYVFGRFFGCSGAAWIAVLAVVAPVTVGRLAHLGAQSDGDEGRR